jgi:hypothetical protein
VLAKDELANLANFLLANRGSSLEQEAAAGEKVSGAGLESQRLGIQTPTQCPLELMPPKSQHLANAAIRNPLPQASQNLDDGTSSHGKGRELNSKAGNFLSIQQLP